MDWYGNYPKGPAQRRNVKFIAQNVEVYEKVATLATSEASTGKEQVALKNQEDQTTRPLKLESRILESLKDIQNQDPKADKGQSSQFQHNSNAQRRINVAL